MPELQKELKFITIQLQKEATENSATNQQSNNTDDVEKNDEKNVQEDNQTLANCIGGKTNTTQSGCAVNKPKRLIEGMGALAKDYEFK